METPRFEMHGFVECEAAGRRLAGQLKASYQSIQVRRFPDGESLASVDAPRGHAVVCHTLNAPNDKPIELLLADAVRRLTP